MYQKRFECLTFLGKEWYLRIKIDFFLRYDDILRSVVILSESEESVFLTQAREADLYHTSGPAVKAKRSKGDSRTVVCKQIVGIASL